MDPTGRRRRYTRSRLAAVARCALQKLAPIQHPAQPLPPGVEHRLLLGRNPFQRARPCPEADRPPTKSLPLRSSPGACRHAGAGLLLAPPDEFCHPPPLMRSAFLHPWTRAGRRFQHRSRQQRTRVHQTAAGQRQCDVGHTSLIYLACVRASRLHVNASLYGMRRGD